MLTTGKSGDYKRAVLESIAGAAVITALSFFLQWNYGFGWADEGFLWYLSQRTFLGEIPVLDYFSYEPGRYYWSSLVFTLIGGKGLFEQLVANAIFGAFGLAVLWYAMCHARISWQWRLVCAILLALALGFPRHKVYEQSLSLIAVSSLYFAILNPQALNRWLVTGVITGLAAFVGRNHGVYFVAGTLLCVGFAYVVHPKFKPYPAFASFLIGIALGYLPMIFMLSTIPGFLEAYIELVASVPHSPLALTIPFPWQISLSGNDSVQDIQLIATSLWCLLVPVAYIVSLAYSALTFRESITVDRSVGFLAATGLAGLPYLHHAFGRADFQHIAQATLPAIPAMIAFCYQFRESARFRKAAKQACLLFALLVLVIWLPVQPAFQYEKAKKGGSGSVVEVSIDNRDFSVARRQSELLNATASAIERCEIASDEFLAAPHFPGIYAFFDFKAPFWELYYLYPRSESFQREHVRAIQNARMILIAPEMGVHGVADSTLKNLYPLLIRDIENRYVELDLVGLPDWAKIYVLPKDCD